MNNGSRPAQPHRRAGHTEQIPFWQRADALEREAHARGVCPKVMGNPGPPHVCGAERADGSLYCAPHIIGGNERDLRRRLGLDT